MTVCGLPPPPPVGESVIRPPYDEGVSPYAVRRTVSVTLAPGPRVPELGLTDSQLPPPSVPTTVVQLVAAVPGLVIVKWRSSDAAVLLDCSAKLGGDARTNGAAELLFSANGALAANPPLPSAVMLESPVPPPPSLPVSTLPPPP